MVTSSDFSKRKFTKGRYVSLKNHFSTAGFSTDNSILKREGFITHAEAKKVTAVDFQAVLKNNNEQVVFTSNLFKTLDLSTYNTDYKEMVTEKTVSECSDPAGFVCSYTPPCELSLFYHIIIFLL